MALGQVCLPGDGPADALGHLHRAGEPGAGQDHRELLAAVAGHHVRGARLARQRPGHALQDEVARGRYDVAVPEVRGRAKLLPNGPPPSDIRNTTYTVESGDIFGLPNGETTCTGLPTKTPS